MLNWLPKKTLVTLPALAAPLLFTWAAAAATLEGTVRDSAGAPLEDVTVWISQERVVKQDKTDKKGRFAVKNIAAGMTGVVAFKEGYALGGSTGPADGDTTVEIVLGPTDVISIRVTDVDGRPVAGASVRSMLINSRTLVPVEDLAAHGFPVIRTTDDGILVIPNLPVGGYVQLAVQHLDYADSSVRYLPVETGQRIVILERGGRASGRITYQGKGVPGARVSIFKTGPQGQKEFAEALTDREGLYSARIELGEYQVAAQHPKYASPEPAPLKLDRDLDSDPVNLEMKSPRYIYGKILMPDKDPCRWARILYRENNTIFVDTYTGADGTFTLRVPEGEGVIAIAPPPGFMTPNFGDIEVHMGDVTEVTLKPIVLERLPVISGTVKDIDGKSPGPVLVTAQNLIVPYSVLSDADGKFSMPLDYMPVVEKLDLRVEHALRFQRQDVEIKLKKVKPLNIKLAQFTPDLEPRDPIPGANSPKLVGQPAPALTGDGWINSFPLTLAELKGKVVVLLFWAGFDESMGPVLLRELNVLHQLLEGQDDIAFISVHDAVSSQDEIQRYIEFFHVPYPVLRDSDEQTTFATYNVVRIPQLVLIDKQGRVRYYQTEGRLLELIKGLRRE